jgi:hypothetical protein
MRFNYNHSIFKENDANNRIERLGQRLSIMLRVSILFGLTLKLQQTSPSGTSATTKSRRFNNE